MKKQLTAAIMGKDQAKVKQERELNSFEKSMQANGFHLRVIPMVEEKIIIPGYNLLFLTITYYGQMSYKAHIKYSYQ